MTAAALVLLSQAFQKGISEELGRRRLDPGGLHRYDFVFENAHPDPGHWFRREAAAACWKGMVRRCKTPRVGYLYLGGQLLVRVSR